MEKRIGPLPSQDFDDLPDRVDTLENDLYKAQREITRLQGKISELEERVASLEESRDEDAE